MTTYAIWIASWLAFYAIAAALCVAYKRIRTPDTRIILRDTENIIDRVEAGLDLEDMKNRVLRKKYIRKGIDEALAQPGSEYYAAVGQYPEPTRTTSWNPDPSRPYLTGGYPDSVMDDFARRRAARITPAQRRALLGGQ